MARSVVRTDRKPRWQRFTTGQLKGAVVLWGAGGRGRMGVVFSLGDGGNVGVNLARRSESAGQPVRFDYLTPGVGGFVADDFDGLSDRIRALYGDPDAEDASIEKLVEKLNAGRGLGDPVEPPR